MVVRLDTRSPDFEAVLVEIGDRATGWLAAESLQPDDAEATESWLTHRFRLAERATDRARFMRMVTA